MSENICRFVRTTNVSEEINIIHFVYEKEACFKQEYIIPACYSAYFVMNGKGVLHTLKGDYPITKGDMFFTFSSKPFFIQNCGDLQYIYIGFVGLRALRLFERAHIDYDHPTLHELSFLEDRWNKDFCEVNENNIDLKCESLLLYTFSFLCEPEKETAFEKASPEGILLLKAYVDLHYPESIVNLKTVCERFHYSAKYVSNAFAKLVREPFSNYLRDLRLNHAKQLLSCGIHSIQEVAMASGFSDSQYFSKVFKKKYRMTPTEYLKQKDSITNKQ